MPPLSDVVVVLALGGMLAVAFKHPSGRVEALVGLVCAAATVATGLLTSAEVRTALEELAPVVAFLVTILVVSDVCARAGLFTAAAQRVGRWSGGKPVLLFTGVFALAAVVTITLSLDATVVLLTPVVLVACLARSAPAGPGHLRLPADGELRLAPAAGLQPDQPAGPAPPRPDLHRVRAPDGAGARRRARRRVRRAARALPATTWPAHRSPTRRICKPSRSSRWSSSG